MNETNGTTNKYRIGQLEKNYEKVDGKLDRILTNHLPHIDTTLEKLNTKVTILFSLNVGALILALILNKFL